MSEAALSAAVLLVILFAARPFLRQLRLLSHQVPQLTLGLKGWEERAGGRREDKK